MVSTVKLGLLGSCVFSFGFISYIVGFPAVLRWQVKSQMNLKKGSDLRGFWEKLPQPMDFNIYMFNVTNANEIKEGVKPILKEVGPFHYDVYRDKVDLVDREEDDTVEYSVRQVWYFNLTKSILPEDTELYTIHPMILALVLITQKERPGAVGVVSKAVDSIFKKPESIFVKTTVKELFFYGLPIDCTVTDFAGSAVCGALEDQAELLVEEAEDTYRFGYFAKSNGSLAPYRVRVLRGIKNYEDVGRVVEVSNETRMNVWAGSPCNDFRGTDGSVFPPFLTEDKIVWAHSTDICRSIPAFYVEPGMAQGFKTLRFSANLGDPDKDKEMQCFCMESEECIKNVFNVGPCLNVPIRLTLPHFYDSDPKYLEQVEGLSPDREKHMMIFDFEAMTSTPIRGYKKIQFNLLVGPEPKFRLLKSFPEVLFPLFWLEDGIELGDVLMQPLKLAYRLMAIAKGGMWLMMLGGVGMSIAALAMHYLEKKGITLNFGSPEKEKEENDLRPFQKAAISTLHPAVVPPNLD